MLETAIELARAAGDVLQAWLADRASLDVRSKGDISNVVTRADLASEAQLIEGIRRAFPEHGILSEESGHLPGSGGVTWVVDPLDGTSNFAAGLPWFGVLLAAVREGAPFLAVLYLPVSGTVYHAASGGGAYCDGRPIRVSALAGCAESLWAVAMDAPRDAVDRRRKAALIPAMLERVRGVRTTNSLVDAAWTADGRLGGWLNVDTRVWDIAGPSLLIREAGGRCTDPSGAELQFDLSPAGVDHTYEILAGAPAQHAEILHAIREVT